MSVDAQPEVGSRDYFRLRTPASAAALTLRESDVAPAHSKPEVLGRRSAIAIPQRDAYILNIQRQDFDDHELSLRGRSVPVVPFPKGMLALVNLALDPTPYRDSTLDCFSFYLRRETFDRLADELGGNRIDDLAIKPGVATDDPVIRNLGSCLRLATEPAEHANALFVDHVVMALHTHLARRYGGMRIPRTSGRGSLRPWQLRIARDTIDAHLDGQISLAQIAEACTLSVSHFARAFTFSTGIPPHRWLMQRRIERAKHLMRTTTASLAEIAVACGFSDQSHLSRVFSQAVGMTPGQWRQARLGGFA